MLAVVHVETDDHRWQVRDLFWEYLVWANAQLEREVGISFDIRQMLDDDMVTLHKFAPPHGRLLLADAQGALAGCACLRTIGPQVGEIKRMYVRPQYRRKGVGRALVAGLIDDARQMGCHTLRLDSAQFMQDAQALYRSFGFSLIPPYAESEIPEAFRAHWVFMVLPLHGQGMKA
jgi:ribosomal protein S18 acetylase RimI-like enzyme